LDISDLDLRKPLHW